MPLSHHPEWQRCKVAGNLLGLMTAAGQGAAIRRSNVSTSSRGSGDVAAAGVADRLSSVASVGRRRCATGSKDEVEGLAWREGHAGERGHHPASGTRHHHRAQDGRLQTVGVSCRRRPAHAQRHGLHLADGWERREQQRVSRLGGVLARRRQQQGVSGALPAHPQALSKRTCLGCVLVPGRPQGRSRERACERLKEREASRAVNDLQRAEAQPTL